MSDIHPIVRRANRMGIFTKTPDMVEPQFSVSGFIHRLKSFEEEQVVGLFNNCGFILIIHNCN